MNLEFLPTIVIGAFIFSVLLIASAVVIIDYTVNSIESNLNNLSVFCSETPSFQSSKVTIGNTVFYCTLSETQALNVPIP